MKKLFLMLAMMLPIFAFVACSDDDEDNPMVGSYQITNTVEKYSNGVVDVLNGTMYDCVVIEYDENKEVIKQDYVGSIAYGGGVSQIIETDPLCKSIIVTFFYLPNDGEYEAINERMAVAQFFEIRPGETSLIYVKEDTDIISVSDTSKKSLAKSSSERIKYVNMIESIFIEE